MSMKKVFKYILGVMIILLMGALASYLLQLLLLSAVQSVRNVFLFILLMIIGAVAFVIINILFYILNRKKHIYTETDGLIVICISSVLYIAFMWLVFSKISVPYELIPNAEMGLGFLQILIQIFDSIGAAVCLIASGIRLLLLRGEPAEN